MSECNACGASVSPGEHFCGNCGTQLVPSDAEMKTLSATLGDEAGPLPSESKAWAETLEPEEPEPQIDTDKSADLASATDNVAPSGTTSTPREGTTGGHRPSVKQLLANTVLNGRYEIVRRIGGGGMGAVYLAKDRNLGDAPRAVKEMVESHLDSSQHEKAIGDFKRESLLLTSLEHPSIPTIYDYFYDDNLGRFYIVMK